MLCSTLLLPPPLPLLSSSYLPLGFAPPPSSLLVFCFSPPRCFLSSLRSFLFIFILPFSFSLPPPWFLSSPLLFTLSSLFASGVHSSIPTPPPCATGSIPPFTVDCLSSWVSLPSISCSLPSLSSLPSFLAFSFLVLPFTPLWLCIDAFHSSMSPSPSLPSALFLPSIG